MKVDRNIKTLRELTLEKMHEAIATRQFAPGDRLVERDLCEKLGVSRTIVREVLRHLEAEGLVQILPQRGPIVTKPTPAEALQIYEIRGSLEGLAARACAEKRSAKTIAKLDKDLERIRKAYEVIALSPNGVLTATTQFYEDLFEGADKPIAWAIVASLHARINYLRSMTTMTPGRNSEGPVEMARIVDAIRDSDPDRAFAACVSHVARASSIAQALLAESAKD
jgi:DNA-binding GntR family transcriptional regulator